ncbi:MAG TPA: AAA family ATPase [Polyangia bacterium]|nr:AAA family ATPase [Polyangia bacterium]
MSADAVARPGRALPADVAATARAGDVSEETLALVEEAASWAPRLAPDARAAFALVVLALEDARGRGATRLSLARVGDELARLGIDDGARAAAGHLATTLSRPAVELAPLVGAPGDYKPFLVDDGFLYAERDWTLEGRLARRLAAHVATPLALVAAADLAAARAIAAPPGRAFDEGQRAALDAALARPLTIITGGPGTGKTALLVGVVRALMRLGLGAADIAVAAPTGRAANRVAESLAALGVEGGAPEPQTLHRLLGFRGGSSAAGGGEFRHHENAPLPHAAVLVDEASMIDLGLMERLARAIRPGTRLVLFGDADQLPSVAAGAVFRELSARAVRLETSHRQDPRAPEGASVLAAARAVLAGEAAALGGPTRARPDELAWSGFERLAPTGAPPHADRRLVAAFTDSWIRARVYATSESIALATREVRVVDGATFEADDAAALAALLAHHRARRVLAVTRDAGAVTSAEALNAALARRAAVVLGEPPPEEGAPTPGTPVLMTRNDYDRGLFNGDQGVVVRARGTDGARRLVVFPRAGSLAAFSFEALREDLRVAYATTVHKAQGAEVDHVALVLPEHDLPLLSRELVYTALTRARLSAVVVGRPELLALAIARPLERASGLAARVARASGGLL